MLTGSIRFTVTSCWHLPDFSFSLIDVSLLKALGSESPEEAPGRSDSVLELTEVISGDGRTLK